MSFFDRFFASTTPPATESYFDDWSAQFRTNAFCEGEAEWFREPALQSLNPDFPMMGPLFRNICARMPERWWFHSITHASGELHDAAFGCSDGGTFDVCGSPFEQGIRICLPHTRDATQEQVANFLADLNSVLINTDGFTRVRWYSAEAFADGCAVASDLAEAGAESPFKKSE